VANCGHSFPLVGAYLGIEGIAWMGSTLTAFSRRFGWFLSSGMRSDDGGAGVIMIGSAVIFWLQLEGLFSKLGIYSTCTLPPSTFAFSFFFFVPFLPILVIISKVLIYTPT